MTKTLAKNRRMIIVSLTLLVALLISYPSNTYAAKFVLRNGIEFGMSQRECMDIEEANGVEMESYNRDTAFSLNSIQLMGVSAKLHYGFNPSEELNKVSYGIGNDSFTLQNHKDAFDNIDEALISKYGSPDNTYISGNVLVIQDDGMKLIEALAFIGGTIYDFSEWVLYQADGCIKISHALAYINIDNVPYETYNHLYYQYLTQGEINTMLYGSKYGDI